MRTLALSLLALSVLATTAQAQYSFTLNPVNNNAPQGFPPAPTPAGVWQAQLDTVDNLTWTLKVFAGTPSPNSNAFQVSLGFTGMPTGGPNSGTGGINSPSFDNWVKGAGDIDGFVNFSTGLTPANDLLPTSTSAAGFFRSTFTLASAPTGVYVGLYGRDFPGVGWDNNIGINAVSNAAVTPELPGAAQLLPALLPMALFMRRRRK
jgi:hypothetical protein